MTTTSPPLAATGPTGKVGVDLLPTAEPIQLLTPDGRRVEPADPRLAAGDLGDGDLLALYRLMLTTRRVDREAVALQRQGQLGAYPPNLGQEAAQVGSAYALEPADWIFPAYRELGSAVVRGLPPQALLHPFRGTWHGVHDPYRHNYGLLCLPIGTQTLHATGFAIGAALDGRELAVLTYLGDGATSEGDTHEALNLAAVMAAPVVFFVQNNQYAISVPVARQTRAPSLAHRAVGYGMPGLLVDGNDVLACYAAVRYAAGRARRGEGPTLIEAVTYRVDGHSTADDWTRYRSRAELAGWEQRDPVSRLRRLLTDGGLLTEAAAGAADSAAGDAAAAVRESIWDAPAPSPLEAFEHVYVTPPPSYRLQSAQLAAELAASAGPPAPAGQTSGSGAGAGPR
jgi:pyruvate dehydrogenase E1 component alpha subunit